MDIALALTIGIAAFTGLGGIALLAGDRHARLTGRALEAALLACLGLAIAALVQLITAGPVTSELLVWQHLGLSVRLDAVSLPVTILVSFVGWVVLRYSRTYLGDEPRRAQEIYHGTHRRCRAARIGGAAVLDLWYWRYRRHPR